MAILYFLELVEKGPSGLHVRQDRVVTQVITRPYTTITYVVTLGGPTAVPTETDATTTAEPLPPAPTSTVAVPAHSGGSSLSQNEIGAIIGSVIAFFIVLLILWYCMSVRAQTAIRVAAAESPSEFSYETATSDTQLSGDPWRNRRHSLNTPPTRIPPTSRPAAYRASPYPQMRGVGRYP